MSVLAQARIEANDAASAPPLIMVKREQLLDILAHLELFGEAIQVREEEEEETLMSCGRNMGDHQLCFLRSYREMV